MSDGPTVTLLNSTPNPEETVCRAARNDYMQEFVGEKSFDEVMAGVDGETLEDQKANLISHMLDRGHYGPTEHISATFAIKGVSRACMAQLTRHRLASFDVRSQRYVSFDDIDPDDVREGELVVIPPSATDAQWVGRNQKSGAVDEETIQERERVFKDSIARSVEEYQRLLDLGMPPEDARFVLPIGSKVNLVMSMNARMLMHLMDMRAAADAQWELRGVANQVLGLSEEWAPGLFGYYRENLLGRRNRLAP